ncbi:citrate transporter [Anaerosporomusa subterranea]|uniref:Citrate transporter n=1 Tax=Anaerosporomusa subterranea TaxID=1794912 RepID=A0A154BQX9_ANASB|nr:citrate:proton symporter [Anaerosporomusa subterranea]KYZ76331.1 citrate transporter [Anaerosporomusa subterranea]
MLSFLGFLTVFVFLFLTMTKRVSVSMGLIIVPVITALVGGFGATMGKMMLDGIVKVAPTGIMITFAIFYFGLMLEVGMFAPLVERLIRFVKGDPLKVVLATAFLTVAVSLDGDGATTFMITISAMLPIYQRLNMSRLVLSGTICLGAGVMNLIPWGGPTARAMTTLHVDSATLFNPIIPAMLVGLVWVFAVAYYFGKKERARVGILDLNFEHEVKLTEEEAKLRRPNLLWFNIILTLVLVVALIQNLMPLPILFMVAYAIALIVNFPHPKDQMDRILAQGNNVVFVSSMIFSAGIFTGILTGTKMITAMSKTLVALIPDALSPFMPLIVALTSMPLSLVFTPDAYYFGVLPIISQTASAFGIDPVHIGRAAILGQMTTGFPLSPLTASTFILVGMAGVDLGEHQKHIFWWAFGSTVVMTIVALLIGAIRM